MFDGQVVVSPGHVDPLKVRFRTRVQLDGMALDGYGTGVLGGQNRLDGAQSEQIALLANFLGPPVEHVGDARTAMSVPSAQLYRTPILAVQPLTVMQTLQALLDAPI